MENNKSFTNLPIDENLIKATLRCGYEEMTEVIKRESRRYAKRQLSWFRRMAGAHTLWVDEFESTEELCQHALAHYNKENIL